MKTVSIQIMKGNRGLPNGSVESHYDDWPRSAVHGLRKPKWKFGNADQTKSSGIH